MSFTTGTELKSRWVRHPDSPGMRVLVVRNWLQELFYDKDFATLGECLRYSNFVKELERQYKK